MLIIGDGFSFQKFLKNEDGQVVILFSVLLLPLLILVGGALDVALQFKYKKALQGANDLSALAVAKAIRVNRGLEDQDLLAIAKQIHDSAMSKRDGVAFNLEDMQIVIAGGSVQIKQEGSVKTNFLKLIRIDQLPINAETVVTSKPEPMEIVLAADLSGMMTNEGQIDLIKRGAEEFVDIMLDDQTDDIKIGIVPFGTGVNLTGYDHRRIIFRRPFDPPSVCSSGAMWENKWWPPFMRWAVAESNCSSLRIQPLTDNKEVVLNHIKRWSQTRGTHKKTNSGLYWSAMVLNSEWNSFWGEDNEAKPFGEVKKIVILMTDGHDSNGEATEGTRQLCKRLKEHGVTIYSMGFSNHRISIKAIRDCATSPDTYFKYAKGRDVTEHFLKIVQDASSGGEMAITK